MNEFTDRIRMEVVPELESRLVLMQKAICKSSVFTRDYKAGVKDTLRSSIDLLNGILNDFDEEERACDGE